ncbi:hypothetical protein ACFLWT_02085 [Chloroflexota bacterium]
MSVKSLNVKNDSFNIGVKTADEGTEKKQAGLGSFADEQQYVIVMNNVNTRE